jgi:hypothetical protein
MFNHCDRPYLKAAKPLVRSPKGTINRKATIAAFTKEMNDLHVFLPYSRVHCTHFL